MAAIKPGVNALSQNASSEAGVESDELSLTEVWKRVSDRLHGTINLPTVWLALQAVQPLEIDGSLFVVAIPKNMKFLAANLKSADHSLAVEEALSEVTGRILAFHIIDGETLDDWANERPRVYESLTGGQVPDAPQESFYRPSEQAPPAPPPPPSPPQAAQHTQQHAAHQPSHHAKHTGPSHPITHGAQPTSPQAAPSHSPNDEDPDLLPTNPYAREHASRSVTFLEGFTPAAPTENRVVIKNWDELSVDLTKRFKTAWGVRYPHGQAQFILNAITRISDTMDALMPAVSQGHDEAQERQLAKLLERLSGVVNLDPMFLSLELFRYRRSIGRKDGIYE